MMPLIPGDYYHCSLIEQADLDNPPIFVFEVLAARQQREISKLKNQVGDFPDDKGFDLIFAALRKHLVGWENLNVDYAPETLEDILSLTQALELVSMQVFQSPNLGTKKKYRLQSLTNGDNSANDVPE